MKETVKVRVLKPFGVGGKEFLIGVADVPEKSVPRLLEKGLISLDGADSSNDGTPASGEGSALVESSEAAEVIGHLQAKLEEQTRTFDRAWAEAQVEIQTLKNERDEAKAETDRIFDERDAALKTVEDLRAEIQALKAAEPKGDGKKAKS